MCLEIEEQQRAPGSRMCGRSRGPERAEVDAAVDEIELELERRREAAAGPQRLRQGVENALEQEREGLEAFHRPFKIEGDLEALGRRSRHAGPRVLAACEAHEARAALPQPGSEGSGRERGELADRA